MIPAATAKIPKWLGSLYSRLPGITPLKRLKASACPSNDVIATLLPIIHGIGREHPVTTDEGGAAVVALGRRVEAFHLLRQTRSLAAIATLQPDLITRDSSR